MRLTGAVFRERRNHNQVNPNATPRKTVTATQSPQWLAVEAGATATALETGEGEAGVTGGRASTGEGALVAG
ncbi:hypothetical protein SBV1_2280010 [Verrucomicrobia bacterium]|nr:hypothetical protein SBV1_2280010 [Verrucomicrobiota bacterium]